jgi:hypothetical protein
MLMVQVGSISGQTAGVAMRIKGLSYSRALKLSLLFACLFAPMAVPKPEQQGTIKAIGCFANVRSDGEHADGFSVRLWLRGGEIIGLIDYHRGLMGDPPMGILTDVRFESSTGKLSFKAKLSSGLHSCRNHKSVPSHDLLSFQGFLRSDRMEGNILVEDQLDSPPTIVDTRQNFPMRKDDDCISESYENTDAWWLYWKPIYKVRGPRW